VTARRQKALFLAVVVVGAAVGFVSAARPWVVAGVADLSAVQTLRATGRQVAGVVPAVALVALAGSVAVLTTRRVGQVVTGTLLVLAGAASATTSVAVLRAPAGAISGVVTAATARTGVADVTASVTAWPWAGVLSGALIAAGGALAVVRSRSWGGLSARYEAPAAPTTAPVPDDDPGLTWDALTRGEDPTR